MIIFTHPIRAHAYGVVLCIGACFCLLSTFWKPPSQNPLLRTLFPSKTYCKTPSHKNPSHKNPSQNPLLRTLLRSMYCRTTPQACTQPILTSSSTLLPQFHLLIIGDEHLTQTFFLKLFGHPRDIPAKSRDIPPKSFWFPATAPSPRKKLHNRFYLHISQRRSRSTKSRLFERFA